MGPYRKLRSFVCLLGYSVILTVAVPAINANAQTSTGIIVESVDDYGGPGCNKLNSPDLCNSIANGDGFLQGMVFPGSRWHPSGRYTNFGVFDSDFVDPEINAQGKDVAYFDHAGTAISYFTGHGIQTDGCSTKQSCTTTSACKTPDPNAGESMPGSCRFSPVDQARCCYMVDRNLVTYSPFDKFGGYLNYSGGPIRWGESPQSGGWAGAGTNGGANLVVLDISHGILPPFWYQTLRNANAGVQMIATMMTAGGDTDNVADRGSTFATGSIYSD